MWAVWVMVTVLLAGCGGSGGADTAPTVATQGTTTPASTVNVPLDCSDESPCTLGAGTYATGHDAESFIPGMTLTLPGGWSSHSLIAQEFSLIPPNRPDDRLFFWEDMVIVKSSGAGHGTTILTKVGMTPKAVIRSLTTNPDYHVISPPTTVTSVDGLTARRLVLEVSRTARYGDSTCPFNPRCADLFARPDNLGDYASIGGKEQVRIDVAAIRIDGKAHTLFIVLDAPAGRAELERLNAMTQPILNSVRLPIR